MTNNKCSIKDTKNTTLIPCIITAGCALILLAALCLCMVVGGFTLFSVHSDNLVAMVSTFTPTYTLLPTYTATPSVTNTLEPSAIAILSLTDTPQPTHADSNAPTPTATPTSMYAAGFTALREIDDMEMVYVPAGTFIMGSDHGKESEQPAHEVFLDAFWIDRYEVTNAQYALCVADGQCANPGERTSMSRDVYYKSEEFANYPVIYISWYQAQNYCEWAGGSLPTEAQWEKAARGTDARKYPWGDDTPTCDLTNYIDPAGICVGDTIAVGSYPEAVSPYGAMDMAGNVAEWVLDWYSEEFYAYGPLINPEGPFGGEYKGVRGGSWGDGPFSIRSAFRDWMYPEDLFEGSLNIDFRCVMPEAAP